MGMRQASLKNFRWRRVRPVVAVVVFLTVAAGCSLSEREDVGRTNALKRENIFEIAGERWAPTHDTWPQGTAGGVGDWQDRDNRAIAIYVSSPSSDPATEARAALGILESAGWINLHAHCPDPEAPFDSFRVSGQKAVGGVISDAEISVRAPEATEDYEMYMFKKLTVTVLLTNRIKAEDQFNEYLPGRNTDCLDALPVFTL